MESADYGYLWHGVYVPVEGAAPVFRHVPEPTGSELQELVQQIVACIGKVLEQRGLIERDMENAWLAAQGEGGERISRRIGNYLERLGLLVRDPEQDYLQLEGLDEESACMDSLRGHSITYRIALGRHVGRKAFTLQTLPAAESHSDEQLAKANGFSLHAGVWAGANDRAKLERLCRYIARPAVSNERIELTECVFG